MPRGPATAQALALLALLAPIARSDAPPAAGKALIEFGWDEPDTAFLRRHAAAIEATPFDGVVFHAVATPREGVVDNFAWRFWGKAAYDDASLAGAFDDLRNLPPGRLTHNLLRVNTTPADVDWFDDFGPILANARLAGRLAKAGRARGVLFDVEQYEGPLFDYRKQRDARTRTWDDYAAQARKRGAEVMTAFQEGFPGLTVLLTFGPSLVERQARRGRIEPRETADSLLVPFLDGMASARRDPARLIDGYEISYGYREPRQFDEALATIRRLTPRLEAGFGLWLDYDWRETGWDVADPSKNHFTPDGFETALRAALERSDEVVWIYTETPRWWTAEGGPPVKLPPAYVDAIRRARNPAGAPGAQPPAPPARRRS